MEFRNTVRIAGAVVLAVAWCVAANEGDVVGHSPAPGNTDASPHHMEENKAQDEQHMSEEMHAMLDEHDGGEHHRQGGSNRGHGGHDEQDEPPHLGTKKAKHGRGKRPSREEEEEALLKEEEEERRLEEEMHRRGGHSDGHVDDAEALEEGHEVIHRDELEPHMLRNRSSSHNDRFIHPFIASFNPSEPVELPKLSYTDLFHRIDKDGNGKLTTPELAEWIGYVMATIDARSGAEQWNILEKASPQYVTWEEFEGMYGRTNGELGSVPPNIGNAEDRDELERHFLFMARRWRHADSDKDNRLTFTEFINFHHPEDKPHLDELRFLETMDDLDLDKDGMVSLGEFMVHGHSKESPIGDFLLSNRLDLSRFSDNQVLFPNGTRIHDDLYMEVKHFLNDLDRDDDQMLSAKEAKHWLNPDRIIVPEQAEAQHLMQAVRGSRPKIFAITLEDYLEHEPAFLDSIATDYGKIVNKPQREASHDEL